MSAKSNATVIILFVLVCSAFVASRGPNFCGSPFFSQPTSTDSTSSSANDSLSLDSFFIPPIDINSNVSRDLLDPAYWSLVGSASATTFRNLLPQTVMGFIDSSQQWRDWILAHTSGEPPAWLTAGSFLPSAQEEIAQLEADALSSNSSVGAASEIQDFAASIGGYGLAALDYVTFGGLTALETYVETGSVSQAVCASFPGQLGQLYQQAFDSSVPRDLRAQYLGEALAITSVIVLVGGIGGFSDKFQGAIDAAGLGSIWETVKPYFSELGEISPKAAALTLTIIETLASRFPQAPWVVGFTADRIDSMADVLHSDGFSDSAIAQKVAGLIQAADDASTPDDVAFDADVISYKDGGSIEVKLSTQNRMYLYSDKQTLQVITAKFLQDVVPGFTADTPAFLKVDYLGTGISVYHYYAGGANWVATVPDIVGQRGDMLRIAIQILTEQEFVQSIPRLSLGNSMFVSWVADRVDLGGYSLSGSDFSFGANQEPDVEGISEFQVHGTTPASLGFIRGDVYLQFSVTDMFGQSRLMRIYYDGFGTTSLGIKSGGKFVQVVFISQDGIRLKVAYSEGPTNIKVATIYESDPTVLYTLGANDYTALPVATTGAWNAFQIEVTLNRPLETYMLQGGLTYDLARLGSEIAYTVGTEKLGIEGLIINEPSQGGADLISSDGTVVMQARFLKMTGHLDEDQIKDTLATQLSDMYGQLKYDFRYNPAAKIGVIVLSYTDSQNNIKTIVLEVLKQ